MSIAYPVLLPMRPDGQGPLNQETDAGSVFALFTAGNSPKAFLLSLGFVADAGVAMNAFDKQSLRGFLTTILNSPLPFRVAGFLLNPTTGDVTGQRLWTVVDLLTEIGR
jgi:hypothetical protein